MTEPRWYPLCRPRAVENGLKARSSRGAIGESWWSGRFVAGTPCPTAVRLPDVDP